MLNYIKTTFYFRESTRNDGTGSINVKVHVNGENIGLAAVAPLSGLGLPKSVMIERKHWDEEEERVKAACPYAKALNKAIAICRERIEKVHMQNEGFDIKVNAANFKAAVCGTTGRALPTFPDLANKFLQQRRDTGTCKSSIQTYGYKLRPLMEFLKSEGALNKPAEEFTGGMLSRYKTYLITQRNNQPRAADKACQTVKTVLIWAASNEYIRKNPLLYIRIRVDKTPNLTCLTQDEVQRLRDTKMPADLRKIADCFVFACYTGMAYHDLKNLTPENIQSVQGQKCLVGRRQKTNTEYCVPVTTAVQEIINTYRGVNRLPLPSNKTYNQQLKRVMLAAGIDKLISSHSARKTFADWYINELGLSEEATIVAMGQKSAAELKPYRRTRAKRLLMEFPDELIDKSTAPKGTSVTCQVQPMTGVSFFKVS